MNQNKNLHEMMDNLLEHNLKAGEKMRELTMNESVIPKNSLPSIFRTAIPYPSSISTDFIRFKKQEPTTVMKRAGVRFKEVDPFYLLMVRCW